MRTLALVGFGLVAALGVGCTAPANPPPAAAPGPVTATPVPPPMAEAPPPPPAAPAPAAPASGPSFLSIVGTPFLIVMKIPVCVITAAVAAPLAGLSELPSDGNTEGQDMRDQLQNGLARNCGPPWTVSP